MEGSTIFNKKKRWILEEKNKNCSRYNVALIWLATDLGYNTPSLQTNFCFFLYIFLVAITTLLTYNLRSVPRLSRVNAMANIFARNIHSAVFD